MKDDVSAQESVSEPKITHVMCLAGGAHLCVGGAGKAAVVSVVTGSVLQTEAGLVALSHLVLGPRVQQLVEAELVHAVVVTEAQKHAGEEEDANDFKSRVCSTS